MESEDIKELINVIKALSELRQDGSAVKPPVETPKDGMFEIILKGVLVTLIAAGIIAMIVLYRSEAVLEEKITKLEKLELRIVTLETSSSDNKNSIANLKESVTGVKSTMQEYHPRSAGGSK